MISSIPTDQRFIYLYQQVILGKLHLYEGLINKDNIRPFSNFVPKISEPFKVHVLARLKQGDLPRVYVYLSENHYVMSDDYYLFFTYLRFGIKLIPVYCMGRPQGEVITTILKG